MTKKKKTKKVEKPKRVYISFTLQDSLKQQLEKLSGKEGRKLATYVKIILNRHLRKKGVN